MTKRKPNPGPNKIGIVASGRMPEVLLKIPSAEKAQAALDALVEVPYQAPDAPKHLQDARRQYLIEKEKRQANLELAKNNEASQWRKVG